MFLILLKKIFQGKQKEEQGSKHEISKANFIYRPNVLAHNRGCVGLVGQIALIGGCKSRGENTKM